MFFVFINSPLLTSGTLLRVSKAPTDAETRARGGACVARRPAESGRLVVRASLTSHSQLTAETLAKGHSWFSPLNLRSYSANAKLAVCAPALVSPRVRSARCVAGWWVHWCATVPSLLRAYLRRLTLESLPSTILTLLKPANTCQEPLLPCFR